MTNESDLGDLTDLTERVQRLGYIPSSGQLRTASACISSMADESGEFPDVALQGLMASLEIPQAKFPT